MPRYARGAVLEVCCALALVVAACDGSTLGPGASRNDGGGGSSPDGGGSSPDGGGSSPDGGAARPPEGPGRWESLAPMPGTPRYYVGVGAVGERVYVVGGTAIERPAASTEVAAYDTRSGEWELIEPLPERIQMPNVAGVGGKLYVLGGIDVKTVVAYDPAARTWTPLAPQPVARGRGQSAVGVWGQKILIAGGVIPGLSANNLRTGQRQFEVMAYDTTTDTWEMLPRLALTRGYCMGAVVGDRFWVMGGSSDFVRTDDVTVLDLKGLTWEDQPALPITLSSAGVSVLNGRIYLVGGIASGTGMIDPTTLFLDPAGGPFQMASLMITPRFAMGAATVGGRIYVPGGIGMAESGMPFQPIPTMEVFIP